MNYLFSASLVFGAALAASLPSGGTIPASTPPAAADTSHTADAMQLYLVVRDKHDKPVLDLKPEDLNVTDDGSPVRLDDLRLISGTKAATNLVTFVFDPVPAQKGHLSKSAARVSNAHEAALKILSLLTESGFEFSVFNIDTRLHLQQGFTPDVATVQNAISVATGPPASRDKKAAAVPEKEAISIALGGVDSSGKRVSVDLRLRAQSDYAALRNTMRITQDRHVAPSLSSLLALVQAQQNLNGRRTIVYFSSMDQSKFDVAARQTIDSIIGSANQAGVTIDVVDCPALGHHGSQIKTLDANTQSALVLMNTLALPGGSVAIPPDQTTLEVTDESPVNVDLKHLAVATGGTYLNGDSQRKFLQQLTGDMTDYYEASFVPRSDGYDGKFHPLIVKPLRTGLRIRTATGYLDLPPAAADGSRPQPFELPLLKLLKQSPAPSQLPFRAAVLNLGASPDGDKAVLALEVPVANLAIESDANSLSSLAHLIMIAEVRDQSGAIAAHFSTNAPQRVALHHSGVKTAGLINLQRYFLLAPGKYDMEVLLLDSTSGKAGVQHIPFTIPDAFNAPSLSNIVLVRRTDPAPAEDDPADPLRDGKNRVTPNLSGALPSGESRISIFFSGHANPDAAQPARLQISILRDGQILGGAPAITRQVSGEEYFSLLTNFSIGRPTDGTFQIEAVLTQGGKSAESDTSFSLSGMESDDYDAHGGSESLESVKRPDGALAITVSNSSVQRPPDDELKALIADATAFANDYRSALPNFTCNNVTQRFVSSSGKNKWEHTDTLTGELTYFDNQEDWHFVESEIHHRKSRDSNSDSEKGIASAGIFGGVIRGLFRPDSQADFTWTQTGSLGDRTVQIFKYHVAQQHSNLNLRVGPKEVITVGYHGLVYIDSETHGVRRISEIADDVPRGFPIRAALVTADYDYVTIGSQQYLVPIGAQVILRKGRHELDLNQIRFENFHRFRSSSRILSSDTLPEK